MRRWPRSKNTIVATVRDDDRDDREEVQRLDRALVRLEVAERRRDGMSVTMPAKMMSEMPLPMPRSVICSPTHMMKAVPVVSVIIVMRRKPQPGVGDDVARRAAREVGVVQRLELHRDAEALEERQDDRAVARVLVDLPRALLALLAELVEGLEDHRRAAAGRCSR